MAITLAQAKVGMADKVDQAVVDEFRRGSLLLDKLTFDDAVSPGTGGSTMTYSYQQLQTPATAAFRALNTEFTPQESTRTKQHADLKIFGGAAQIDRVIQDTSGNINEVDFQLQQQIKAATNLFHYATINGDATTKSEEFDGLDVMLTGKSTEYNTTTPIDLSTSALLDTNYKTFLDMLDEFLSGFDGKPDLLMGNAKLMTKIRSCARRAGYLSQTENSFGKKIEAYNDIPLMDLGYYYDGSLTVPVTEIYTSGANTGLTDLYGVGLGLDAFHAASPKGSKIINTYLPDMKAPNALKKVEVEMVAAAVLKNSRKAGTFRKIKVQ